jgi:hypothetical protein
LDREKTFKGKKQEYGLRIQWRREAQPESSTFFAFVCVMRRVSEQPKICQGGSHDPTMQGFTAHEYRVNWRGTLFMMEGSKFATPRR